MIRPGLAVLAALLLATPVSAQMSQFERVRDHREQALAALDARNLPLARQHADAMTAALPNISAFAAFQTQLAHGAGDLTQARERLAALVAMGRAGQPAFDPILADLGPDGERLKADLEANRKPQGRSKLLFTLTDQARLVEGIAHDRETGDWFFSSVIDRTIIRRTAKGAESRLALPANAGAIAGLAVDARRRRLWFVMAAVPQMMRPTVEEPPLSGLGLYDLEANRVTAVLSLPAGVTGQPGDLAVADDGQVFLADDETGALYRTSRDNQTLETLLPAGILRSAQGLVVSADGNALIVSDYSWGLALVDRTTGAATPLLAPEGIALDGIDGLVRAGRTLIAIQNGFIPQRILRLDLDATGRVITRARPLVVNHPQWVEPTQGVIVKRRFAYIANSQWPAFGDGGTLNPGYRQEPTVIHRTKIGR